MKLLSITTVLTLAVALGGQLSTGCALEADEVASDSLNATESVPPVTCNDGALVVQPDPNSTWEYLAIVYDQGVVDWFVAQSEQLEEVPVVGESNASTTTVQKELPWMVTIVEDADGRRLVLRDLRRYDDADGTRFATSGPPGSSVEPVGEGMKLSINGSKMIGSHAVAYYNVGEWTFERCE